MQIIIDQKEIEQAITNHVHSLLTIKEGQDITIDLKAGRGEAGFTATIEIGSKTEVKTAPAASTVTAVKVAPTQTAATPVAEKEAAPQAEPVADPVATAGDDAGLAEEAPADQVPVKPAGSLFGGLTRPNNNA